MFVFLFILCCPSKLVLGLQEVVLKVFNVCIIASKLIGSFFSQKSSSPNYRPSKRTKVPKPEPLPPSHLPVFLETRGRCESCSVAGKKYNFYSIFIL